MYLDHFSLDALPFENRPDPDFFLEAGQYGPIVTELKTAVEDRKGLSVITGPEGSGKTNLGWELVNRLSPRTVLIRMAEPPLKAQDLYTFMAREMELDDDATSDALLQSIYNQLISLSQNSTLCLLLIDEFQRMNDDVLESVRVLSDLEAPTGKLLQLVLLGQPELADKEFTQRMEPLRQQASVIKNLRRLSPEEAKDYILHRLARAGAVAELFTPLAIELAAFSSDGIPRHINDICHESLRQAFEAGNSAVEEEDVQAACRKLGFKERPREQDVTPPPEAIPTLPDDKPEQKNESPIPNAMEYDWEEQPPAAKESAPEESEEITWPDRELLFAELPTDTDAPAPDSEAPSPPKNEPADDDDDDLIFILETDPEEPKQDSPPQPQAPKPNGSISLDQLISRPTKAPKKAPQRPSLLLIAALIFLGGLAYHLLTLGKIRLTLP